MQSVIASHMTLPFEPVALVFLDEKPESSLSFAEGKWGCVMSLFAQAAAKGAVAAFTKETYGCVGGGVGMGFGNCYETFPGGTDCFCRFLSTGNEGDAKGEAVAEQIKPFVRKEMIEHFLHGEGYQKSPEQTKRFLESLKFLDLEKPYVALMPLSMVPEGVTPEVVIFVADAVSLSGLIFLAAYDSSRMDATFAPFAAGCQAIGIIPMGEADEDEPRAVIGLADPSARAYTRSTLGDDVMTFAMPWKLFERMERNAEESFLTKDTWKKLVGKKEA